jgi:hypothetical protein
LRAVDSTDHEDGGTYPAVDLKQSGLEKVLDAKIPYFAMRCVENERYRGYYVSDFIRDNL